MQALGSICWWHTTGAHAPIDGDLHYKSERQVRWGMTSTHHGTVTPTSSVSK